VSETTNQISRREILKRGAFVGGAVVWATPVVQTLGMGRAFAATPSDTCIASWADKVESYSQGLQRDGNPIIAARSNVQNALGAPSDPPANPGEENFFSLGFKKNAQGELVQGGGTLIVRLGTPYYSGQNGEAVVIETTLGSYPLESAHVFVGGSATGPWTLVGLAKNTTTPSLKVLLDGVGGLPAIITHIKIHDWTDPADFPLTNANYLNADAFDVKAVGISCPTTPTNPV